MRDVLLESLKPLAQLFGGLRVLLWGFSGKGFPNGDGADEAVDVLSEVGLIVTRAHDNDPQSADKLSRDYDVVIICNTRVGAVLMAPPRLWEAAPRRVYWFHDLRPGSVGRSLRGRVDHVFLTYNGSWESPDGIRFSPAQWSETLGCPVGYAPQAAPLRTPQHIEHAPRAVFVGDLANKTYHRGRTEICRALGATVINSRTRAGRLEIEGRLPGLYPSARYCLSMSPLAPGYTSVRTYSIMACGGAMLLHRFPGADELFCDGEDAVLFDSAEDLLERVADLDRDDAERQRIAANGRRLHAQNHTVAHRVLSICRQTLGVASEFRG